MAHKYTTKKIFLLIVSFALLNILGTTGCKEQTQNNEETAMQDESGIPALLERKGELAKAPEWEKTKEKVAELKQKVAANPADMRPRLQLATIYMVEGRVTGNSYYNQATIKILDGVLEQKPDNFEANTYKASVAMSLHQYEQAKKLAEKALAANPNNAYVYGVLVDANVELGNYQEAIAMSDKMQAMKPSLESYSRASYLREIHGDYNGAIEAMAMAVKAGVPGSESAEWARVTLGDLYLNTGKLDEAKEQYETSLQYRPDFPNAEIGIAKVYKTQKNYDAAIQHTEKAISIVSEAAYVAQLGELYELKGNEAKAKEIKSDVVRLLEEGEKEQNNNKTILMKHNANRELAIAYMNSNELNKALEYAKNDLALRPNNIDANELAAWLCYRKGDYAQAKAYADKMLATNTKNANTLYKASMIYAKAGEEAKGKAMAQMAANTSPYIDERVRMSDNSKM